MTALSFFDALRREISSSPRQFDPEANDGQSLVQPLRKVLREFQEAVASGQRAGAARAREAANMADLTDDAKARLRREALDQERAKIASASRVAGEAWTGFLTQSDQIATAELRPKSALPAVPNVSMGEAERVLLENVRAGVRATEDMTRRLAEQRAESVLARAFGSDPGTGQHVVDAYARVRGAEDPLVLDAFERLALDWPATTAQHVVVEAAIRPAQLARLPEPIVRLAMFANFLESAEVWRQAITAESAGDPFFEGKGLQPSRFVDVVGPELAAFALGAGDVS